MLPGQKFSKISSILSQDSVFSSELTFENFCQFVHTTIRQMQDDLQDVSDDGVCVCVREREREREKERERESVCVRKRDTETQRDRETERECV